MLKLSKQRGFTMTELMVAVAIGLLGTIIIFRTFANSSGINENIGSVSDATQNGSIGLYSIEQDARNAGYGLNFDDLLGCTVNAHNETLPSGSKDYSFILSPLVIIKGTATTSDTIRFTSSRISNILPSKLTLDYDGTQTPIALSSRYGISPGTLLLLSEPSKPCTILQVTEVATAPGDNTISHVTGTYTDTNGSSQPVQFNKTGGPGTTYKTGAFAYNIGQSPQGNEYTVVNNKLVVRNRMLSTSETVVVPDIVLLKASYGLVDASGDITFTDTTPITLVDWKRTTSVKVALVSRTRTPDYKNGSGAACATTTGPLTWSGGSLDLSATSADWKCYRYRVFETTVMLRNLIWTPT